MLQALKHIITIIWHKQWRNFLKKKDEYVYFFSIHSEIYWPAALLI